MIFILFYFVKNFYLYLCLLINLKYLSSIFAMFDARRSEVIILKFYFKNVNNKSRNEIVRIKFRYYKYAAIILTK